MATLVKTGIGDGQTLTPVVITELYDAFIGEKVFDNIKINNRMKITHDGKVAIGVSNFATPYELNVQGTVAADTGRFTNLVVTSTTFQTSSTLVITGSNNFGSVAEDLHQFTGSIRVSGSSAFQSYFLNGVVIGKEEATRNAFEVSGSATISNSLTASNFQLLGNLSGSASSTGSFGHLSIAGDAVINGNLTFGNSDTDSISFVSDISSSLLPDANNTYNIGSATKKWNTIFGNTVTGSLVGGNNIFINSPNIIISSSLVSGSLSSTSSFGRSTVAGNLHVQGTASIGHMVFNDFIQIETASLGSVNISSLKVNNTSGSENTILRTDGSGNVSFDYADRTAIVGKNISGDVIAAGTPVYIENYQSADLFGINFARADDDGKNPAIGLLQNQLNPAETGSIILSGLVRSSQINTSAFSVGTDVYLNTTGGLTSTKPGGAGITIQKVGQVVRQDSNNGEILVLSAGGAGGGENLATGQISFGVLNTSTATHISGALNTTPIENITVGGDVSLTGDIIGSNASTASLGRAFITSSITSSTAITTNNITNGYPTSNKWQQNLQGSFFNNFTPNSHVSEILRFMAGVLSHSLDVADASPNTKFWNTLSTSHTQGSTTSKSSLLNGVLNSTYENARLSQHWTGSSHIDMSKTGSYRSVQKYLILKGFVQTSDRGTFGNDTGTNPFHGSYASRIPSTIQTNGTFDTLSHTLTANAGGSSAVFSNSDNFGMGGLTSGNATAFSVKTLASQSFSDNYADSTPDKDSTFHTSSFRDFSINSFSTSNGLTLAKIETNQPAVIPAAFQDGDFNSVAGAISGRYYTGGSANENNISASGYYATHGVKAGLKSGSMSNFQYKDGSDSTTRFYLYAGGLPSDITDGAATPKISKNFIRTSFSATSRSLSGAPYLLTTNYQISYSAHASGGCFDPCYGFNSSPLVNSKPTDTWDNVGSTSLTNTTVSVTNSGVQSTGNRLYVISDDFTTKRTSNSIPHITDVTVASSSFTFSLDGNSDNVVSARSTQEDLNYSLAFRTTARNWKNSSTTSTTSAINLYTASLFSQPASSGSMAIYSRAQGYDSNTLADTTETFTGEDFRIVLADNVQAFNGAYFTTDSFKTNDNGDAVLGNFDLQVKPGFLVDPGGTKGYWFPSNFGSGTYKYYIRRFQKSSGGTKTSMTINLSNTTLVAWNSTSNGVACAILFESSGNGSGNNVELSRARIFDPTATTSNVIETNISNDNHKNPFSTAIDLYGNTGGSISSNTYTIPIRNADGMFLDDSDNELYVLVRYKSDPTPITSITLSYS